MKKNRTFSLRLILGLIVFLFLSQISFSQNCLKMALPHDPENGYFNPDSVLVDTCANKIFAKGDFQIIFRGDPFKINTYSRDTVIYRTWVDLDSTYQTLKSNLKEIDSIFGNFILIKVYPDITDSSHIASGDYVFFFSNYVDVDSVCKQFKIDSNVLRVIYLHRENIACGSSLPIEPGFKYGELISQGGEDLINNLHGDGIPQIYSYKSPSLGWHISSLKLPLAWEITKGKGNQSGNNKIKYLIVDEFLGPDNHSWTYPYPPDPLNPNYKRTYFQLFDGYFKSYGHGIKHWDCQIDNQGHESNYTNDRSSTGDLFYYSETSDPLFGPNCGSEGNIFLPYFQDNKMIYQSQNGDGIVKFAQINGVGNTEHGFNILSITASKHNQQGIAGVAPDCLYLLCCKVDIYNLGRYLYKDINGGSVDVDGNKDGILTPPDIITESYSNQVSVPDNDLCDILKNGSLLVTVDLVGDNSRNSLYIIDDINKAVDVDYAIRTAQQSVLKFDYKTINFGAGDAPDNHMYYPGNKINFTSQNNIIPWDSRISHLNPHSTSGGYIGSGGYFDLTEDRVVPVLVGIPKLYVCNNANNTGHYVVQDLSDIGYTNISTGDSISVKFNTNSGYVIQRPRLNCKSASADVILPRGDIIACNIVDKQYGEKGGKGSYTVPILGGILALMRSVDKYLGVSFSGTFDNATDDERLDISRKAYNIVTFSTYKVSNSIYPTTSQYYEYRRLQVKPVLYHYNGTIIDNYTDIPILGDPLDRWFSTITAFGKVNPFRCVMHCIPKKAAYEYNLTKFNDTQLSLNDDLKFETHMMDGKNFIHFGNHIKEGSWVNENNFGCWWEIGTNNHGLDGNRQIKFIDINRENMNFDGTQSSSNESNVLNVLEWGGRHFPGNTTEPWKNNWGETILKDGITITVPDDYVACIDGILRQPNEDYELSQPDSYTFTENKLVTSGSGKILFTGFLRDIELNGSIKLDDLDIHTSALNNTNNIGRITVKNNGSENSEIYGKVNVYDNSSIGFGTGTGNVLVL